jgi:hypothetical protein
MQRFAQSNAGSYPQLPKMLAHTGTFPDGPEPSMTVISQPIVFAVHPGASLAFAGILLANA